MIKVSIHQPMYLPYTGVFDKIKTSDIFVFLDDVQYSNQYYYNRNRIKSSSGEQMLTVPVKRSFGQKLNEVKIENNILWQKKHMKALIANYNKSGYFKDHKDFFEDIYSIKWEKLHDLNMHTIEYLLGEFEIDTPFRFSSDLLRNNELNGTGKLVEICMEVGADVYLSGASGKDYLDITLFENAGINVEFQDYEQKEYKQLYSEFIPNLSAVDMLFNLGAGAKSYI